MEYENIIKAILDQYMQGQPPQKVDEMQAAPPSNAIHRTPPISMGGSSGKSSGNIFDKIIGGLF